MVLFRQRQEEDEAVLSCESAAKEGCVLKQIQTNKCKMNPDTLVLSGGGTLLYAHLGALWALESRGVLSSVTRFVGVSAGAILALLTVAGLPVPVLCDQIFGIDFFDLQSFSPLTLVASFGLDSGHRLLAKIWDALESQGWSRHITLRQLKERTGKELVIGASDVSTRRFRLFTSDDDVPAALALRASIAIPLLYTPVSILGGLYVDGGLMDNFPMERVLRLWPECKALGVNLRKHSNDGRPRRIDGLMDYAAAVFACIGGSEDDEIEQKFGEDRVWVLDVHLDVDASALVESPSMDRKRELFTQGFVAAGNFCLSQQQPV